MDCRVLSGGLTAKLILVNKKRFVITIYGDIFHINNGELEENPYKCKLTSDRNIIDCNGLSLGVEYLVAIAFMGYNINDISLHKKIKIIHLDGSCNNNSANNLVFRGVQQEEI